ncbi:MAG: helix-turn-helix domain-containing protein [Beijerinckiaceae bacterium]|nr:helix-turn-helix domain-containing protein [Beijerinckiaceae bacterium]
MTPTPVSRDQALADNPPPAELQELSRRLSPGPLLALIEAEGGCSVYVPVEPNQGMPLARAIGLDAARSLAAEWGGDYITVPLARAWRVRVYRSEGATQRQIARRLGISESQVWKLLRDAGRTGAAQADLFG